MASPSSHDSLKFEDKSADHSDSKLVREQLERILVSPAFKNSKRYAAVLKYITEQALAGYSDRLKERTIGVDVFGREPDYDTASDHVVRSAMAEVRKRLAQYYQADAQRNELQVELQPGSYIPQFRSAPHPARPEPLSVRELAYVEPAVKPERRWQWMAAAGLALLVFAALLLRFVYPANDALTDFWRPVLVSSGPAMLCIGNLEGGIKPGFDGAPLDLRSFSMGDFHRLPSQMVHVSDVMSLAKFVGFLQSQNKRWRIVPQSEATYGDLRTGPAILIGLMNNDWTERVVRKLRYRAEKAAPRKVVIRDSRNPAKDDWSMDYSAPLLSITRDYALVLRVFDPNADQTVITAAGISVFGTQAAAEFLTDAGELSALDRAAPGWRKKNMEIVLSTEVVRAKSGRPQILAVQLW